MNSQSSYHANQRLPDGRWLGFLRGTGGEYTPRRQVDPGSVQTWVRHLLPTAGTGTTSKRTRSSTSTTAAEAAKASTAPISSATSATESTCSAGPKAHPTTAAPRSSTAAPKTSERSSATPADTPNGPWPTASSAHGAKATDSTPLRRQTPPRHRPARLQQNRTQPMMRRVGSRVAPIARLSWGRQAQEAARVTALGGTDDFSADHFPSSTTNSENRRCCAATGRSQMTFPEPPKSPQPAS